MIRTLNNNTTKVSIDMLGAQLISIKDFAGKEYIWQRNIRFWNL